MSIEWNKVTRVSQVVAIVLFVGVFVLGFWLGTVYEAKRISSEAGIAS
jgi:hypothetical protein